MTKILRMLETEYVEVGVNTAQYYLALPKLLGNIFGRNIGNQTILIADNRSGDRGTRRGVWFNCWTALDASWILVGRSTV